MLRLENVTKHYPGTDKGITNLTLEVKPGELCAFIGHNGAGKTTAIKALVGIHGVDSGEICIDGVELKGNETECKKKMAYIPDSPELYGYLTGMQYLAFVADVYGVSSEEREEKIEHFASIFEMREALGELIATYSHGMRQKLAIISAMLHSPKLLVLDEPFVGLDPKAAAAVKEIMRELCKEGGAVLFSTHVLEVAERLCDKVALIKNGRVAVSGAMSEVVRPGMTLEDIFMEVERGEG